MTSIKDAIAQEFHFIKIPRTREQVAWMLIGLEILGWFGALIGVPLTYALVWSGDMPVPLLWKILLVPILASGLILPIFAMRITMRWGGFPPDRY